MAYDINRVCNSVTPGWKTEGLASVLDRGKFTIRASATGGVRPSEIAVYAIEKSAKDGTPIPCIHSLSHSNLYTKYVEGCRTFPKPPNNPESWLRLATAEVLEWVYAKNAADPEDDRFNIKLIERLRRFIRLTSC